MTEQQTAIIARIEAATGANDDIDLAIATWCYENGGLLGVTYDPQMWIIRHGGEFTRSLDWAVRLVPDGWRWICDGDGNATLLPCDQPGGPVNVHAATAPLALCLAALKAWWA